MKIVFIILMVLLTSGCVISVNPDFSLMQLPATPTMATSPVIRSTSTARGKTETPAEWISCTVTGELHVRTNPAWDASVQGYLRTGDIVTASIKKSGEWRQVQSGVLHGWAHGDWLKCAGR
jgi:uncharacterized protein YgiM (DUF1202 family)